MNFTWLDSGRLELCAYENRVGWYIYGNTDEPQEFVDWCTETFKGPWESEVQLRHPLSPYPYSAFVDLWIIDDQDFMIAKLAWHGQ